jgi:hypothetical protein
LADVDAEDEYDAWDEADEELGSGHLLECCGSERPRRSYGRYELLVTARGAGGFLTVHDYVEQVHPWLMSLKGDIIEAKAVANALLEGEEEVPQREELLARDGHFKLFVAGAHPKYLVMNNETQWVFERSRQVGRLA